MLVVLGIAAMQDSFARGLINSPERNHAPKMLFASGYFFDDNFYSNIVEDSHKFIERNVFQNSFPTTVGFLDFELLRIPYALDRSRQTDYFRRKMYEF